MERREITYKMLASLKETKSISVASIIGLYALLTSITYAISSEGTLTLMFKLILYMILTLIGVLTFFYIWFSIEDAHRGALGIIYDIYLKHLIDSLLKEEDEVLELLIGAAVSAIQLAEKPEDIYKAIEPLKEYLIQRRQK